MSFNYEEQQYLRLLHKLISEGHYREGRNGNTYSMFGEQMKFDLRAGFPLMTTKETWFHGIKVELIWMLRGMSNINWLLDRKVHIWDKWADRDGDLGPIYGVQWRAWDATLSDGCGGATPWEPIDQMQKLIDGLKADPYGRRHIVTAWNPAEIDRMALPPCHMQFQCHVADGRLNLHMYQRSADWLLGVPFNIAQYALLTHLLARECGFDPGVLTMSFGDFHLYSNHLDAAKEQLGRTPYQFPDLILPKWTPETSIFKIEPEEIGVVGYQHHPKIVAEVSA